jgi:hypothetical protein
MKLAILGESPADEAGVRTLVDAILGIQTTPIQPTVRARQGHGALFKQLPAIIRHLHYQTDAAALAVVVDSDDTPVHLPDHAPTKDARCRLCLLRWVAQQTVSTLRPRPHASPLRFVFGLAVPSLEAWLLFGRKKHVSEAAWLSGRPGYSSRDLKIELYGSVNPGLVNETNRMIEEAARISTRVEELEKFFPNGFGVFHAALLALLKA